MAFTLELLTNGQGDPIEPAETDLAFFVSEGFLHGHSAAVPAHIRYWRKQRELSHDIAEPGRESIADTILSRLTLNGTIESPAELPVHALLNPDITREVFEGFRRNMIGGLAVSLALRRGLGINMSGRITDVAGSTMMPDVIPDLGIERSEPEWPYPPRIHKIVPDALPFPVVGPDEEPLTSWYRLGRNLLVQTVVPADITPPRREYLETHNVAIDPSRLITFFPHIIAQNSPLNV
ncbi:MAG TPA: hypothetical protein VLI54_00270 [Bacillota bacterium]|nr:hypothetical protein [Bacillota bacterium]